MTNKEQNKGLTGILELLKEMERSSCEIRGEEYRDLHYTEKMFSPAPICRYCHKDIGEVNGCSAKYLIYDSKVYTRSTEHFGEKDGRCNDCNSKHGMFHHFGCDVERCAVCNEQALFCYHMDGKITDSPGKKMTSKPYPKPRK